MRNLSYILLGAAAITAAACDDALEASQYTKADSETFPNNEEQVFQMVTGVYQNLNQATANPQYSWFYYSELASDDRLGGGGTNDNLMQAFDLLLNYGSNMTSQFWSDRWVGIVRANSTIEGITETPAEMTDDNRNTYEGEARFLRAYYYYELASMYGKVPLVLTTELANNAPASASEMWGQILLDLKWCADNMPSVRTSDSEQGRVDKYSAEAMLARAYLFYTGFYCNGETLADLTSTTYNRLTSVTLSDGSTLTDAQVVEYLEDCINNSGYALNTDFRENLPYTNSLTGPEYSYADYGEVKWAEDYGARNNETLFSIKYSRFASWSTTIGYANEYALHFGVRGGQALHTTFPFGQGWGAGPVAPNLYEDWVSAEPTDSRRNWSVADVRTELDPLGYTKGGWADWEQETDYYCKKNAPITCSKGTYDDDGNMQYYSSFETAMFDLGDNADNFQLDHITDLILIRFADVLLMHSELTKTADGINKVRERAGLDDVAYSEEALRNERRWELAFEGTRFNDIRRWHIAADALAKQQDVNIYSCGSATTNKEQSSGGYRARYNATAGFAKIPETEISLSGNVLEQVEGYGSGSDYTTWSK